MENEQAKKESESWPPELVDNLLQGKKTNHKGVPFKCNKCGKSPKIDKEKSNAQWDVFDFKCACGGKMEIVV